MPTLADLEFAFLGALGATGATLADRRLQIYGASPWSYFSTRSGLAPVERFSLADHQLAYFRGLAGTPIGTLSDVKSVVWTGAPPAVTQQPSTAPQSLAVGATLNLSSAASGIPPATVQWQRMDVAVGTWNDIAGATSAALAHVLSAGNGYVTGQTWRYRAVWTNFRGSVQSNVSGDVTIL